MSNILVQMSEMSKISLKQKSFDEKYDTNRILFQTDIKDSTLTYYLPTYIQLTFQSISNIDYEQLNSRLLCLIIFQINVCGLDNFLINYLKNNIVLYFNESNKIPLTQQYNDQQQGQDEEGMKSEVDMQQHKQYLKGQLQFHYLKFTIKKDFITRIVADVDWTPFQLLNFVLTVQPRIEDYMIEKILKKQKLDQRQQFINRHASQQVRQFLLDKYKSQKKKLKLIALKFNLMDCKNKAQTINCPLNKSYGNYKIAIFKLNSQYTYRQSPKIIIEQADQINQKEQLDATEILIMQQNKVKSFQNGHFIIPVYKIPNSTFATILIPMLLLTIINLCIFNQTDRLTGRIANLGALILAFLAIFPVIREQIPRNPKVTKIQLMVYLLVGTDLLCFIQSIRIRGKDQPVVNIWEDAIFIVAVVISAFVFIVMIILIILHKCKWEPGYLGNGKILGVRSQRFDHKKWKNQECDSHFMRFFDQQKIKPLNRQRRQKVN